MAQPPHPKSTTVLIVEHEALVRLELAGQLRDMGLSVLIAINADEAIGLLENHAEIALILTDITMPGSMDGIRLAHHVRGRWPPLKIIVTSGLIETKLSDLPHNSLFLPKPWGPKSLHWAVSHMLDGGDPRASGPAATLYA